MICLKLIKEWSSKRKFKLGLVYKLNTKINIGILDYGVGNITLINCLNSLGQKTKIISNSKDLKGITVLILPCRSNEFCNAKYKKKET